MAEEIFGGATVSNQPSLTLLSMKSDKCGNRLLEFMYILLDFIIDLLLNFLNVSKMCHFNFVASLLEQIKKLTIRVSKRDISNFNVLLEQDFGETVHLVLDLFREVVFKLIVFHLIPPAVKLPLCPHFISYCHLHCEVSSCLKLHVPKLKVELS